MSIIDFSLASELHLAKTSNGGPSKRKNTEKEKGKDKKDKGKKIKTNVISIDNQSSSSGREIIKDESKSMKTLHIYSEILSDPVPLFSSTIEPPIRSTVTETRSELLNGPDEHSTSDYEINQPSYQIPSTTNYSSATVVQKVNELPEISSSHSIVHTIKKVSIYFLKSCFKIIWCDF